MKKAILLLFTLGLAFTLAFSSVDYVGANPGTTVFPYATGVSAQASGTTVFPYTSEVFAQSPGTTVFPYTSEVFAQSPGTTIFPY